MRKLIYILPLLLVACEAIPKKPYKLNYKQGDIVYIKPDSTKVVITYTNEDEGNMDYHGYSRNKSGDKFREDFMEFEIY